MRLTIIIRENSTLNNCWIGERDRVPSQLKHCTGKRGCLLNAKLSCEPVERGELLVAQASCTAML